MAFSNLEKAMALVIGLDIARPGTSRKAAKAAVSLIGRSGMVLAPRAAAASTGLVAANPITAGVGLGLGALQTDPGQQLLDMAAERGRSDRVKFEQALTDLTMVTAPKARKKARSKFNKAVSAGMKAAKASTSYGKKGTLNNAKKAFTAVTKEASRLNKGAKLAPKGVRRKIGLAIKKVLK
jgi:CHASE2 domain-containing sensor protein